MAEPAKPIQADELEAFTEEVIAACHGNPREAIKVLLAENAALEEQVCRLSARVSTGYARGLASSR